MPPKINRKKEPTAKTWKDYLPIGAAVVAIVGGLFLAMTDSEPAGSPASNPRYFKLLEQGMSAYEKGQFAHAQQYFSQSIQEANTNTLLKRGHLLYGVALNAALDYQRGEEQFRKALSIDPYFEEALENMGNMMYGQGRLEEAKQFYERGLAATEGKSPNILYHLAVTFEELGQIKKAVEYAEKALQNSPLDKSRRAPQREQGLLQFLFSAYRSLGKYDKALGLLARNDDPRALALKFIIHNEQGGANADQSALADIRAKAISEGVGDEPISMGQLHFIGNLFAMDSCPSFHSFFKNKQAFHQAMSTLRSQSSQVAAVYPAAFELPSQWKQFSQAYEADQSQPWLLKPLTLTLGEKKNDLFSMINSETYSKFQKEFENHKSGNARELSFLAQHLIANPMLINSHKFDILLSVLITSLDTPRIYLSTVGSVRITENDYEATDRTKDVASHVAMYDRTNNTESCRGDVLDLKSLQQYLGQRKSKVSWPDIWSNIRSAVVTVFGSLYRLSHDVAKDAPLKSFASRQRGCQNAFEVKINLDKEGRAYVVGARDRLSVIPPCREEINERILMIRDSYSLLSTSVSSRLDLSQEDVLPAQAQDALDAFPTSTAWQETREQLTTAESLLNDLSVKKRLVEAQMEFFNAPTFDLVSPDINQASTTAEQCKIMGLSDQECLVHRLSGVYLNHANKYAEDQVRKIQEAATAEAINNANAETVDLDQAATDAATATDAVDSDAATIENAP